MDFLFVYVISLMDSLLYFKKKCEVIQKKHKQKGLEVKEFNILHTNKISIFIISIILMIAFSKVYFWLNYMMSSIYVENQNYRVLFMLYFVQLILYHIYNGIKKIGKKRANEINIQDRLLKGENIWNLYIIDNIDF